MTLGCFPARITSVGVLVLLALSGCADSASDPPVPGALALVDSADSESGIRGESAFRLISRDGYDGHYSLNETISRVQVNQDRALVIKESVEGEVIYAAEGSISRFTVEAYRDSDLGEPVWSLTDSASVGGVWKPGFGFVELTFYRTMNLGCCSASNTQTLYDLETGEVVMVSDSEILVVYWGDERAYLGFRSINSASNLSPKLSYETGRFGVLNYVSTRERRSIVLHSPFVDSLEMRSEPTMSLVSSSGVVYKPQHESDNVHLFYFPSASDSPTRGVAVRLDFWSDSLLYLLPLTPDGPTAQGATLPDHVTATGEPLGSDF